MLFLISDRNPPEHDGPLLIAEYVRINPQTEIPTFVNAVAAYYITHVESGGQYVLRGVARSITGDLRTVSFLWEASSRAVAVDVAQKAAQKLDKEDKDLIAGPIQVNFMQPTAYDKQRGLSKRKRSAGGISLFTQEGEPLRFYESDGDLRCALHDHIFLKPGSSGAFMSVAQDLLPSFEDITHWTFTGAGQDLEKPDHLMHFWRMVGISSIPPALTKLPDIPTYANIQDFIVTERQHLYLAARNDLPIGSVQGDPT